MSEIDHGAEAQRWLEYAADDLRTAEFLLQQPDFIPLSVGPIQNAGPAISSTESHKKAGNEETHPRFPPMIRAMQEEPEVACNTSSS